MGDLREFIISEPFVIRGELEYVASDFAVWKDVIVKELVSYQHGTREQLEEIVRCDRCRFNDGGYCACGQWRGYAGLLLSIKPDGYCAWGEAEERGAKVISDE